MPIEVVYTIKGNPSIEVTQRGYVVRVRLAERSGWAQLTDARDGDRGYSLARAIAESIRRGRWVSRRKDASLLVRGRRLHVKRDTLET